MTSVVYASLAAAIIVWLAFHVIKTRRRLKILYGDGANEEMIVARSAHANAVEYIPIALILLFGLEYNNGNPWLVHAGGMALIVGRIIHARGMLTRQHKKRVLGMQVTLTAIITLSALNIVYLPIGANSG